MGRGGRGQHRLIHIGERPLALRHKAFAGNACERVQDARVADPVRPEFADATMAMRAVSKFIAILPAKTDFEERLVTYVTPNKIPGL